MECEPIRFFVPGNPKGLKRHRTYRAQSGLNINVDPNAVDKKDFLAKAMLHRPEEPWRGPICLRIVCVFGRPQSHFRTGKRAGELKDSTPSWLAQIPDWDNVGKFVGDALNGIFWYDDRLIVKGEVVGIYGSIPGIAIHIWQPTHAELVSARIEVARCPQ